MPRFEVELSRRAARAIEDAPPHIQAAFVRLVRELEIDPTRSRSGLDTRKLAGLEGTHRARIGTWRVLYVIERARVRITSAAPRGRVYK